MTDLKQFVLDAAVKPLKPLTPCQQRVAELIARGWGYKDVAGRLNVKPRTVRAHVEAIAALLPNEDNLSAHEVVQIWALCTAIRLPYAA